MKDAMRRIIHTVFVSIAVLILLIIPSVSNAATPTPTQIPTPTTSVALPTGAIIIPNGLINERIAPPPQDALPNSPTATISGVPTPPPEYKATVPEVKVDATNFNVPKLDEIADWLTNVTRFMSAKQVKDNVIPHQDNLYISGQARRCITVAGFVIPDQIGDKYKTALVPYLPKLITATGLLSAQTVRNTVTLTDGKYTFEGPSYEVDGAPPCDTAGGVGTAQEPKQIVLAQGQGNKFIEWIKSLLEKFTVKTVFISKQLCPECERIHCQLTGCVKGSVDLAYMDNPDKQKIIKESGGIADAFRTVNMDTTKGESPNGQEQNFTKTNTAYTKQMENSADLIKCSLLPPQQQKKMGLAGKCSGFVKPITSCGTALPDMTVSEAACKLKNIDKINLYAEVKLPQDYLPPTMAAIVEKAADTYKVPASSILAIMGHEQGFNRTEIVWNEENVKQWSMCGGTMPFCDAAPNGSAQAPYGFFANWFYKDAGTGTLWDAVTKVDPSRTKENISLCNFMDVTFAVAKALSITSAYRPVKDANMQTCFGLPMTNTRRPASCSRSEWTNAVILQSHVSYAGYCPETNREYPYIILAIFDKLIFKFTNNM